jgi:CDP-glucose 4,6-dehydratase
LEKWQSALEGLAVNPNFWRGKRIFLTGHTGFKGSWLSLWLQSLEANVTGYALPPPTTPSLFEVAKVAQGMSSIIADIRDLPSLQKAMQSAKPDVVIHMAAQPLVRQSYKDPVETYTTNVLGTVNVLESVRKTQGVKAVLVVTTDKCYENKEELSKGYCEKDPLGGHDPYSSSKACAELVTAAYRTSFLQQQGLAVATARAGNVIGGGDWATDRLLPDILRAFEQNSEVHIRNPHATRPWQHVLEPLCGYLTLIENLCNHGSDFSEGWNFGPQDEDARPVQWIVDQLANSWGIGATWRQDLGVHPQEANYLKLDITKTTARLEWQPTWSLQTALQKITHWHRAWLAKEDMKKLCLEQILQYSIAMKTKEI